MSTAFNTKLVAGSKTPILLLRSNSIFIDFSRYFLPKFCYSIYNCLRFRRTSGNSFVHSTQSRRNAIGYIIKIVNSVYKSFTSKGRKFDGLELCNCENFLLFIH
ncbi:hypothetical protein G4B88_004436 [Cannabis sativa]|uniref:Uncharacterized protein n=1 Tax=Cannabis sativa TaxID=3483 RepID=A0A7J6I071_CANSA|nr:hypothetical protein G4B88_004436 [Cannabis sativa]